MKFGKLVITMLTAMLFFGCAMKNNEFHYIIDVPAFTVHCVGSTDQIPGRDKTKEVLLRGDQMWILSEQVGELKEQVDPHSFALWYAFQLRLNKNSGGLVVNPDKMIGPKYIPAPGSMKNDD